MAHYYSESEADPAVIRSKVVAVLGYGNQGHAHALNLRDSGVEVVVGSHAGGKSWAAAEGQGFRVLSVDEAARGADLLVMSLPDVPMSAIYKSDIEPHLRPGQTILFVHGFNIRYNLIQPGSDVDVIMVSPKGPGAQLRTEYSAGRGLAALVAVHQDASGSSLAQALSYAQALGCFRSTVLATTFREETECDLFGEQAVLCGGLIELVKAGFETLVAAGYEPEAAYFECVHETKLIVDLLVTHGLSGMRLAISDTAEWGGYLAGPRVVNEGSRAAMKELLAAIQDGSFARDWIAESQSGERLRGFREEGSSSQLESVGSDLIPRILPK